MFCPEHASVNFYPVERALRVGVVGSFVTLHIFFIFFIKKNKKEGAGCGGGSRPAPIADPQRTSPVPWLFVTVLL